MSNLHTILLDGSFSSALDWSCQRKEALMAIAAGKKLLWHIELGLFKNLCKPLSDSGQFLNLSLALKHFKDKLWKEFHLFTYGVLLFRIRGSFIEALSWDAEQMNNMQQWLQEGLPSSVEWSSFRDFETSAHGRILLHLYARDVATDYLRQLALQMPPEIPLYVDFETGPEDAWLELLLTHPERYKHLQLLSNHPWRLDEEKKIGVCMPPAQVIQPSLFEPYQSFVGRDDLKWIPEEGLTANWDGLDRLFYSSQAISQQGFRKIQGFLAAGGEAIELENYSSGEEISNKSIS